MAKRQPHLESRPTGYYWRRRVPAREALRFESAFFCFPLHTNAGTGGQIHGRETVFCF